MGGSHTSPRLFPQLDNNLELATNYSRPSLAELGAANASNDSIELFDSVPSFGGDDNVAGAVFSRGESITSRPTTSTQLESLDDVDRSGIAGGEASLPNPPNHLEWEYG